MRPTIEDVAARAGVSRQTVSRVINNHNWVSEDARARVLSAIQELGYRRNALAGGLRSGQSRTIGLSISDIANPAFAAAVRGVQDAADAEDYQVILCNTDENTRKEDRSLRMLREKRVEGAIIIPCHATSRKALDELVEEAIPVVLMYRYIPGFDSVIFDSASAVERTVQHLVDRGHERIAMVLPRLRSPVAMERRRAYKTTLERNGHPYDPQLVRGAGFDLEAGYRATLELLEMENPPTAVFTGNNPLSVGALLAIKDKGLSIPNDVAMVGYNERHWSRVVAPPLTTVEADPHALGLAAGKLLLRRIGGDQLGVPAAIRLPTVLTVRESSGPPARRRPAAGGFS